MYGTFNRVNRVILADSFLFFKKYFNSNGSIRVIEIHVIEIRFIKIRVIEICVFIIRINKNSCYIRT